MRRFAFFDLDETLIRCKSLLGCHAVLADVQECTVDADWSDGTSEVRQWLRDGVARGEERDVLNRAFYRRFFSGVPVEVARAAARKWYERMRCNDLYHDKALAALDRCRVHGHEPVIVTGSFREVVALVAAELGIEHFLCAPLAERDGCYTGLLSGAPMIGFGLCVAVVCFLVVWVCVFVFCFGFGVVFFVVFFF